MIRVDAHQHFWKLSRNDYEWLTPDLASIYRDFMPDDLAPHLNRSGVDRTVAVQAATTDAETAFLLDLAQQTPFIAGVVGWTDLESPRAVERVESLAANRRLFGLRPMLQDLPDDEWLVRRSVAPAIAAMKAAQLRLDALVKPRHLPMLLRFLERHPDLRVVIDHGAKPAIASNAIDEWATQMREIGRRTNAFCKLSGLATEAGANWTAATLQPYVDVLLDAFGPRRLMWGSDWPVLHLAYEAGRDGAATPYDSWRDTATSLVARLSSHERELIFGGTAARFYGIA
jgi:L-fuconolactonase